MSKLDDILDNLTEWDDAIQGYQLNDYDDPKRQIKDLMIEIAKNTMSQADFIKYVEAL